MRIQTQDVDKTDPYFMDHPYIEYGMPVNDKYP